MDRRRGFTLIELLIVMVVLGILAAIVIPKFSSTREKAYVSAMKSDLKNLASRQEVYYADQYLYTSSLATLQYQASEAVTVSIGAADGTGWSATASHTGTSEVCAMFIGTASAVSPATEVGVISCG